MDDSTGYRIKALMRTGADKISTRLKDIKSAYINFVSTNPESVAKIKQTIKTTSYIFEAFSRNYDNSIFVSELLTSACNLFAYANLRIIKGGKGSVVDDNILVSMMKQVLIVTEFSQAFLELSAHRIAGPGARWAVIVIISLIKTILRCILLFLFKSGIQYQNPAVSLTLNALSAETTSQKTEPSVYTGPRSGHKMHTLASTSKKWAPPSDEDVYSDLVHDGVMTLPPTPLSRSENIGEYLHACRPLVHLLSLGLFGTKSTIPWLTALVTDTSSHALLQRTNKTSRPYNSAEQKELKRRYANIILYLLRTPIYDNYTGPKIMKMLKFLSDKVPLARFIATPISLYLPAWQKVYFYTWAE